MVIDDNALNRDVLTVMLKEAAVSYTTLASPLDLTQVLDGMDRLDAVFLDLEMPGMDGFEALDLLKAHPLSKAVPVIAYTVHVSQVNQAKAAGFDGFMAKPIDANKFLGQLGRILRGESVWEI
ncbi:MAG TPA: response regulator [Aggregatilineales bacterium]|nr:response regulator [Aggregatilineales bacterium]